MSRTARTRPTPKFAADSLPQVHFLPLSFHTLKTPVSLPTHQAQHRNTAVEANSTERPDTGLSIKDQPTVFSPVGTSFFSSFPRCAWNRWQWTLTPFLPYLGSAGRKKFKAGGRTDRRLLSRTSMLSRSRPTPKFAADSLPQVHFLPLSFHTLKTPVSPPTSQAPPPPLPPFLFPDPPAPLHAPTGATGEGRSAVSIPTV